MINNNWPPSPADPPIEIGPPTARADNRVAWRPLLLRMFVVVPPAQVLGIVAGAQLVTGTGLLERAHWLSAVISVISGVSSGLAVRFFLTPTIRRLRIFALVAAGFGLTTSVVLAVLSEVRLAGWGWSLTGTGTYSAPPSLWACRL
jgi:phage shock protein PspC (stress-responsive transcriptional regulator)